MKNKKGFTLIEIIVCIGLIVLIGTSSIVGFKVISNKKLINKLDSITERASEAAQVYIETNDTAYNQLYNNKNGVSLPLRVLVNEGLLSLEGTDLTEKDIENQYVVTFLGGTGSSENCEQITSTTSWGNDKAIYLCMNSNGSSNLAIIDPTKYSNKTNASSEPYYFTGISVDNYIKSDLIGYKNDNGFNGNVAERIFGIDRDDSIIVAIKVYNDYYSYYLNNNEKVEIKSFSNEDFQKTVKNFDDFFNYTFGNVDVNRSAYSWMGHYAQKSQDYFLTYKYYVRLPNTCKITSGTGMSNNPFEITC